MTCRRLSGLLWAHEMSSGCITDDWPVSDQTYARGCLLPPCLYADAYVKHFFTERTPGKDRKPTLNPKLVEALQQRWGARYRSHPHPTARPAPQAGARVIRMLMSARR